MAVSEKYAKIEAMLRRMTPQQRQQFAAMRKNDPDASIVIPMALSITQEEQKRAQAMQAAQMGAAGMQQPPKVVDQALAGIANLPTQDAMNARMADGGIIGPDDMYSGDPEYGGNGMAAGGVVERYQDQGLIEPTGRSEFLEDILSIPRRYEEMWQATREKDRIKAEAEARRAAERNARIEAQSKASFFNYLFGTPARAAEGKAALAQMEADRIDPTEATRQANRAASRRAEAATMPAPVQQPAPTRRPAATPSAAAATTAAPMAAAPITPASAAAQTQGISALFQPATAEELGAQARAMAAARDAEVEKDYAPFRTMLEEQAKELRSRGERNKADALVRAGLAMMAGTSPNALRNIGEGAIKGLDAYQEAQKQDEAARRALTQSQLTLMQAQRAERSGNMRDAVALSNQARQEKQFGVSSALQAQQIKQTGEYQQGSLEVQRQQAANYGRLVGARINALQAPERDKQKAMAEWTKVQGKVMDSLKNDATYQTMPEAQKAAYLQRKIQEAIAVNPFLSGYLFTAQPTGTVRDLEDSKEDKPE